MHPMEGVWLKIDRAKEHLDVLKKQINDFMSLEPCALIPIDGERSLKQFKFQVRQYPPIGWGVVVGDICFNLRSALDHLVWQLALLTTDKPTRRTEFPIFNTASDYNQGSPAKLRDVLPQAHSLIQVLQPYNRPTWPDVDVLWWLHELNRIDKHQTIVPSYLRMGTKAVGLPFVTWLGDFQDGTVYTPAQSEGAILVELMVQIGFKIPSMSNGFGIDQLSYTHAFIRGQVMPHFASFFPELER